MVTLRDIDFIPESALAHTTVKEVMTPFSQLYVMRVGSIDDVALDHATEILRKSRKGKLPIVDNEQRLVGLMSRTDLKKRGDNPNATLDDQNQQALDLLKDF